MNNRSEIRYTTHDLSKGEIYHAASDRYFKVTTIRDVSTHGMGLELDGSLKQGDSIRLGFKLGRVHLQTYGHVAWCAPAVQNSSMNKTGLFAVGISM